MGQEATAAQSELETTDSYVKKCEKIASEHKERARYFNSLEAVIAEIRNSTAPEVLKQRAETQYKAALVLLERKLLDEQQAHYRQLLGTRSDVQSLSVIPNEAEKQYTSVRTIAKEYSALEKADSLYGELQQAIRAANVPRARQALGALQELEAKLNREYTTKVTGGKWRYPNDNPGAKNYYIIVEATDAQGNPVELPILSEEDGQTKIVSTWGERVPEEVYEQVKTDKMDNGIIENNQFGVKKRGYLNEEVLFKNNYGELLKKGGQITHW